MGGEEERRKARKLRSSVANGVLFIPCRNGPSLERFAAPAIFQRPATESMRRKKGRTAKSDVEHDRRRRAARRLKLRLARRSTASASSKFNGHSPVLPQEPAVPLKCRKIVEYSVRYEDSCARDVSWLVRRVKFSSENFGDLRECVSGRHFCLRGRRGESRFPMS